jgi:hypothetical protein
MRTILKLFFVAMVASVAQFRLCGEDAAKTRILMLGPDLKGQAAVWNSSGLMATAVEMNDLKNFPKDAGKLTELCDIVVVFGPVDEELAGTLEPFVRGGGGLIISVPTDWRGRDWSNVAGSMLDIMSPALAADMKASNFPVFEWNDTYKGPRFDMKNFPKLKYASMPLHLTEARYACSTCFRR